MNYKEIEKVIKTVQSYSGEDAEIELRDSYMAVSPIINGQKLFYFLVSYEKPGQPYGITVGYAHNLKERYAITKKIIEVLKNADIKL